MTLVLAVAATLLAAAPALIDLRGADPNIVPVVVPDQIRSIDRPQFDPPSAVRGLLQPGDLVVGLADHAYPIDLLSLHEVVNDGPVAITWCPLCRSALAFERRVRGRTLTFGVSGYLLHGNQVLYDRQTGSLWSQLLGRAISGRYRGTPLRPVPLVEETWSQWLAQHPRTTVLSIRRDALADRFTHPYSYTDSRGEEESFDPYAGYVDKVNRYFPEVVRGLPGSALVLGVRIGGVTKAYPLDELRGPVRDVVAGRRVLVVPDPDAGSAAAFVNGRRVAATPVYWFAWRAFYPRTLVYRRPSN